MKLGMMITVFLSIVATSFAGDIVLDGTAVHYLNPNWDLAGKDLIVRKGVPYLRVNTRGNCHYEYEQECHPKPDGGMDCKTVPKWVCDYRAGLFTLPATVKTEGSYVRFQDGEKDVKIGKMKSFLWWKWVSLEDNIGIWTDISSAKLIIRDAATVLQEVQFQELHQEQK